NKKRIDLGNHVVLLFGDLGVGERVESLLRSRSEEKTRWRKVQGLVYVLGLFHVKMACADAVWRTFIEPARARNESDDYSLMANIKVLRPRETGKISSKPGFRRMHEVIQHSGIVMRLDCWRLEIGKISSDWSSLDDYAKSEPTWDELKAKAAIPS
ncbi:hypothetical protein K435DRAFT_694685, partial [Dendrothele bispora CBS 962.96]